MDEIRELRRKIERDILDINKLKRKKVLNFAKTQPGTPNLQKVMVSGSHINENAFLLYCIKDEEVDELLELAMIEYNNDVASYNELLKYLSKYDSIILIEYLKNELNYSWHQIDSLFCWGEDTARTKVKRYLKATKKD